MVRKLSNASNYEANVEFRGGIVCLSERSLPTFVQAVYPFCPRLVLGRGLFYMYDKALVFICGGKKGDKKTTQLIYKTG